MVAMCDRIRKERNSIVCDDYKLHACKFAVCQKSFVAIINATCVCASEKSFVFATPYTKCVVYCV